jgi:hypothetical protein
MDIIAQGTAQAAMRRALNAAALNREGSPSQWDDAAREAAEIERRQARILERADTYDGLCEMLGAADDNAQKAQKLLRELHERVRTMQQAKEPADRAYCKSALAAISTGLADCLETAAETLASEDFYDGYDDYE